MRDKQRRVEGGRMDERGEMIKQRATTRVKKERKRERKRKREPERKWNES